MKQLVGAVQSPISGGIRSGAASHRNLGLGVVDRVVYGKFGGGQEQGTGEVQTANGQDRDFRSALAATPLVLTLAVPSLVGNASADDQDGIVTVKSRYSVAGTVARIKRDVGKKGVQFFGVIDQAKLGNAAGNSVSPSRLVMSATRRCERPSSPPNSPPVSTGRSACWSTSRRTAQYMPPIPISTGWPTATALKAVTRNSRWRPR
ncbi:hypothetical protein FHS85_005308 [Rhodoligotrophos appendicifer]